MWTAVWTICHRSHTYGDVHLYACACAPLDNQVCQSLYHKHHKQMASLLYESCYVPWEILHLTVSYHTHHRWVGSHPGGTSCGYAASYCAEMFSHKIHTDSVAYPCSLVHVSSCVMLSCSCMGRLYRKYHTGMAVHLCELSCASAALCWCNTLYYTHHI